MFTILLTFSNLDFESSFKLGILTIIGNFTFGIEEQFFYKWKYMFDMKTWEDDELRRDVVMQQEITSNVVTFNISYVADILNVFEPHFPFVSSTKPYIGFGLGIANNMPGKVEDKKIKKNGMTFANGFNKHGFAYQIFLGFDYDYNDRVIFNIFKFKHLHSGHTAISDANKILRNSAKLKNYSIETGITIKLY